MKALVLALSCVCWFGSLWAQVDTALVLGSDTVRSFVVPDTVATPADPVRVQKQVSDTLDWRQRHLPRKATLLSAVIPGAGQIYNRKYWKAPIVWGGLGLSYWFIQRNTKEYRRYKDAYIAVVDNDPTTIDEFNGEVSASQLLDVTDTYRKWRDISFIAVGAVYILNIVDATVDAYFVRFDVGRDLSFGVGPSLEMAAQGAAGISARLIIK